MLMIAGSVATSVFSVVGQAEGGRIMARIFPTYYAASLLCPAAALALVLGGSLGGRRRGALRWPSVVPLALALLLAACNAFLLAPRIEAVRTAMHAPGGMGRDAVVESFGRLHLESVIVMGTLIVLALFYVLAEALGRPGAAEAEG
jgi:hypothetical protein